MSTTKTTKRAKTDPGKAKDDGLMSVADIARKLKIDPKVARAKLRRHKGKPEGGRWPKTHEGSQAYEKIVAILKPAEE